MMTGDGGLRVVIPLDPFPGGTSSTALTSVLVSNTSVSPSPQTPSLSTLSPQPLFTSTPLTSILVSNTSVIASTPHLHPRTPWTPPSLSPPSPPKPPSVSSQSDRLNHLPCLLSRASFFPGVKLSSAVAGTLLG